MGGGGGGGGLGTKKMARSNQQKQKKRHLCPAPPSAYDRDLSLDPQIWGGKVIFQKFGGACPPNESLDPQNFRAPSAREENFEHIHPHNDNIYSVFSVLRRITTFLRAAGAIFFDFTLQKHDFPIGKWSPF